MAVETWAQRVNLPLHRRVHGAGALHDQTNLFFIGD